MSGADFGYDKERFPNLNGESFDCIICACVVKNPRECTNCGSMFCAGCIESWLKKTKECPNRCPVSQGTIRPIGKALLRIYNDLDIQCCYYDKCGKIVKLSDLEQHERVCQLPKCANFELCGNHAKPEFDKIQACSSECALLIKIKKADGDWGKIYNDVKEHLKLNSGSGQLFGNEKVSYSSLGNSFGNSSSLTYFRWDTSHIGTGIEVNSDRTAVFLKEGPYMFRSVLGDQAFEGGVHYWELIADSRTENELKIGVTKKRDFNLNSAFCDYDFGYAYYGLGQLRHASNASGASYGKKFKKEGVLGVFLDMNRGILSFSLNGEYMGVAFQSDALKKGPIWPAVSLLHCAGCKLETGKKIPEYFFL